MTWTYNPASVSTALAKVRLYIGDTNTNDQLLSDEEVAAIQGTETNLFYVAARCCDAVIAKLARDVDRSNLGMSATRSTKIQNYEALRDSLYKQAAAGNAGMFVGGVSESANETLDADADNIKPLFKLGQFNNPGAS